MLLPLLAWLAPAASLVMLLAEITDGGLGRGITPAAAVVFVIALYGQFFATSPLVSAVNFAAQTLLAIALIVRWRLDT